VHQHPGAIISAVSRGWLVVLRFLGGLGMGGSWSAGASLVAETWDARHRALIQMGLPVGSMLAIGVVAIVSTLCFQRTCRCRVTVPRRHPSRACHSTT
jgi:MFS family permease